MNSFPKEERLSGRTTINEVFSLGKRFTIYPFRIIWRYRTPDKLPIIRFGITVPKKISKKAVVRNRIKRCTREAYRTAKQDFIENWADGQNPIDVFLVYTGNSETCTVELQEKIILILKRLTATNGPTPR